jgi:5'-nucleotidase
MRVLLSNDDGFGAAGIQALEKVCLKKGFETWVIAPDGERSGVSQALTHHAPIKLTKIDERHFKISGTPVDCVRIGRLEVLPFVPDFVLSGVNHGANLGSDVLYSGTAAVARQAGLMGLKSIAFSLDKFGPSAADFDACAEYIYRELDRLMSLYNDGFFLNVNVPQGEIRGTVAAPLVDVKYDASFQAYHSGHCGSFYFPESIREKEAPTPDSDWGWCSRGYATVTPVPLIPQDETELRRVANLLGAKE